MTRRILQIIATLDRAGAEKQLALLAAGLPRNEFDVHVCAITRGGPLAAELERAQVSVEVIGKARKFDPASYLRLRKHIARIRPDLVQTWMFTANAYGRAAAHAAGVRTIVASERCVDPWKRWYHWAIDRRLAKHTRAIVVNSRGVQEYCVAHGLPQQKFRLIYNGVGPAMPSAVTREALLAELGLPSDARLIGAVGRLWPQKRVTDLIQAMTLLGARENKAHLLIVGNGPQRGELELASKTRGVAERVHFLGARDGVPRLMPHFDLFWQASEYEGLPNAVMEAMACGVPVVASDIWGNRELVIDGETGYLAPMGNQAGLAECARRILADPQLGARLGAAGKLRMEREFTIAAMVEKHAALYRELLE